MYGIIDSGYKTETRRVAAIDTKTTAIGASNQSSSRLGFRGTEDIGGGMKANFVGEFGLKVTDASMSGSSNDVNSSTMDNRQTFVGLSGGFGSVTLGRQNTTTQAVISSTDAAGGNNMIGGTTYVGGNSTSTVAKGGLLATPFYGNNAYVIRSSNALAYTSPTMSGFKIGLGMANNTSDIEDVKTDLKAQSARVEYANGPLMLIAGQANIKGEATGAALSSGAGTSAGLMSQLGGAFVYKLEQKETSFGGTYDLGVAKLFANHLTTKAEGSKAGTVFANNAKRTASEVGVQVPMGAVTAFAKVGTGKTNLLNQDIALAGATQYKFSAQQVGASYAFSKRTNAYLIYGSAKADMSATTDMKNTATAIGLRHAF
jgi:predicted porin